MKFTKSNETIESKSDPMITYRKMGDIREIQYLKYCNKTNRITLLDKDHYMINKSGEILLCNHIENRNDNIASVKKSLKRLRDLINANVYQDNQKKCRWITLTYRENMTDPKRLYKDFDKFMKRVKYNYKDYDKYIVAMEPQGRGAWHCHLILIFKNNAPYISTKTLQNLWQQGDIVSCKKITQTDNLGAYLSAYLGDMEFSKDTLDILSKESISNMKLDIKEIDNIDGKKLSKSKQFIKGARMCLYPPKFNLYRCSRNCLKPTIEMIPYEIVKKRDGLGKPSYTSAFALTDTDNNYSNLIIYEQYNINRDLNKDLEKGIDVNGKK